MPMTDEMDHLLKALRDTAREEDRAEEVVLAAASVPALDERARQRIADVLVAGSGELVSLEERRRKRRRWATLAMVPLAVAASAALVVRVSLHEPAGLPEYALVATGGLRDVRGLDDLPMPVQRLGPHSVLDVKLRPATTVEGDVFATAFLVHGDRVESVSPTLDVAPSGAVSVRAEAATVFGDRRGPWELRILLLRPELTAKVRTLATGGRGDGRGWQRLSVPIELLP